jgi:hypothetical protein
MRPKTTLPPDTIPAGQVDTAPLPASKAAGREELPLGLQVDAPVLEIPPVALGFEAANPRQFYGYRPTGTEVQHAIDAVTDLERLVANDDASIPTQAAALLATSLTRANDWRLLRGRLDKLVDYVRTGDAYAWKAALTKLEELRPIYEYAARSGAFVSKYPGLAEIYGSSKSIGKAGSATKKKNKLAKAEASQQADIAAATQAGVNAVTAAKQSAADAAATIPTKTVTVNLQR